MVSRQVIIGAVWAMAAGATAAWSAAAAAETRVVVKIHDALSAEEARGAIQLVESTHETRQLAPQGVRPSRIERLFVRPVEEYQAERQAALHFNGVRLAHLENYFYVIFSDDVNADQVAQVVRELEADPAVETAYVEPVAENAVYQEPLILATQPVTPEADTPDFEARQFHLEPAPRGVNAFHAWTIPGGDGTGIKVIDVEYGWRATHEDFTERFWHNGRSGSYIDHGTAVWGEVAAKRDGKGVTGIAYNVVFGTAGSDGSARVYDLAASQLEPGDILIIEQHARGPDSNKFTAMENWQANFDAFKAITSRGIYVLEAAGNGNSNFDSRVYQGRFDLSVRDSGAILVGAGGPPGSSFHQRLSFSNYGSRVDAFGYGNSVVTAGYGNLFNGGRDRTYTATFSGTSSATPIVAGAVAAVAGVAKMRGIVLTPAEMRAALRATGTPQQGDTAQRIGNLPDIEALLSHLDL